MSDPRIEAYARLLVEYCLDVRPGWQVLIQTTPLARPLVEELCRQIAARGAYALQRIEWRSARIAWAQQAPSDLLAAMPPIDGLAHERSDGEIVVLAPENTREDRALPPDRRLRLRQAAAPVMRRRQAVNVAWISCVFPTPALAQDAGMSLAEYTDFVYGACLVDWKAEGRRMRRLADRFDQAQEIRLEGAGTDLRLSIAGRRGRVGEGYGNMPGGEIFYSPVEDSAEGTVAFGDYPMVWDGEEVEDVHLRFAGGRVVDASARRGEELLLRTLETDDGARALGELGLGHNPRIRHFTRNILFDEKMEGTIHLALGSGFPSIGGRNVSSIHWDLIKDMRAGGRIYCDGELVQRDGVWLL